MNLQETSETPELIVTPPPKPASQVAEIVTPYAKTQLAAFKRAEAREKHAKEPELIEWEIEEVISHYVCV